MHANLFVELGVEAGSRLRSYLLSGVAASRHGSIVAHRCERAKLANRWLATVKSHDRVSRLFDIHTRLKYDLVLLLRVYINKQAQRG
jgi:hypothetical protein